MASRNANGNDKMIESGSERGKKLILTWNESPASLSLAHLAKTANLAEANASQEDKIKAMMIQSSHQYDPTNYMKKPLAPPPSSYTCHRCRKPGHSIKNCPTTGDESFVSVPRMKKSTGIPRTLLVEVKDPNVEGVMLTKTGKYAIPCLNVEAYARTKKEKPPFLLEEPSSSSSDAPIPDELLCLICKEIMTDAAIIPCCGNGYCDECIRTALLESEERRCPECHQTGVSPDAFVSNKCLRRAVSNFKNGAGYRKRHRQQVWHQQQLPLPPPLLVTLTPPAALVTAAEASPYSSLSISSLLEEKVIQQEPVQFAQQMADQAGNYSVSKKITKQGQEQAKYIIMRQQHRKRMWKRLKEV
ncbi:E3 ubiquitin-protein ligase RBBP6-like [Accipiter gentilis]|uniref:E3 ubiquitin-protein ligase RBBP6-like n=1 Tax=Astur gentilis TaxID=8957 RepID=UPI002110C211|nr:E3 ubiquitin-protein ligase RBBP6-like [Accipiter gentilis]